MKKFKFLTTFILSIILAFSLTACGGGGGEKTEPSGPNGPGTSVTPPTPPAEVFNEVTENQATVYNKFASAFRNYDVFDIYDYWDDNYVHFAYEMDYNTVFTDLISNGSLGCEEKIDWTGESVVWTLANNTQNLLYKEAILTDTWGFDVYGSDAKQQMISNKYAYYRNNYVYNSVDNVTASKIYDGGSKKSEIIWNRPGGNLSSRLSTIIDSTYNNAVREHGNIKVYLNEDENTLKFTFNKAVSFEDISRYTIINGNNYVSTYRLEQRKDAYTWTIVNNYEFTVTLSFNADELGNFVSLDYAGLDVKTIADTEETATKHKVFSSVNISEKITMLDGMDMEFPKYILDME